MIGWSIVIVWLFMGGLALGLDQSKVAEKQPGTMFFAAILLGPMYLGAVIGTRIISGASKDAEKAKP